MSKDLGQPCMKKITKNQVEDVAGELFVHIFLDVTILSLRPFSLFSIKMDGRKLTEKRGSS